MSTPEDKKKQPATAAVAAPNAGVQGQQQTATPVTTAVTQPTATTTTAAAVGAQPQAAQSTATPAATNPYNISDLDMAGAYRDLTANTVQDGIRDIRQQAAFAYPDRSISVQQPTLGIPTLTMPTAASIPGGEVRQQPSPATRYGITQQYPADTAGYDRTIQRLEAQLDADNHPDEDAERERRMRARRMYAVINDGLAALGQMITPGLVPVNPQTTNTAAADREYQQFIQLREAANKRNEAIQGRLDRLYAERQRAQQQALKQQQEAEWRGLNYEMQQKEYQLKENADKREQQLQDGRVQVQNLEITSKELLNAYQKLINEGYSEKAARENALLLAKINQANAQAGVYPSVIRSNDANARYKNANAAVLEEK